MVSSWADRADAAEQAVYTRYLRRLWALPGTRLGRNNWPTPSVATWNYWWQAHLLDCALDAYQRAPSPSRHHIVAGLVRGIRIRNLTSWVNNYHDDISWLGLALQRAAALAGVRRPGAEEAIARRLRAGLGPSGGMRWRVGDDFINVPATGPAAIFFARRGDLQLAASLAGWVVEHLIDPDTGLAFDGLRVNPDGSVRTVERAFYTYCQGVLLGACVELAASTGEPRWSEQADRTVRAVAEHLTDNGVLRGQGGGDGGLFAGILARYLVLAARVPSGQIAAQLVLDSAEAAWSHQCTASEGPVFGPQWTVAAVSPGPSLAECDLSVQLSGWMLLEAAAALARTRPD
ncbi:MAG TPA: glycoside hydrolase family 76 protein [Pseudonocardiaceae bacterium]